jgi:hypothetical protein
LIPYPPPRVDNTDGSALFDDVAAFVRRFVAFPSDAALTAVTLWVAHAHVIDCFENTARLALLSPEPGSGKTRSLEVLELLCPDPMHVLNASPAAIFRTIQRQRPTLLLDEVDTVFTRKGKDDEHADLRGLLNSGYRAGATIPRCVGPRHDVELFPTFCAVALAGLGDLPDTLMTRSVVIRMRRRAPGEKVEPFRRRLHRDDGEDLHDRLADWAGQVSDRVTGDYPDLPDGIVDRPADVWEPLLSVADAAGGHWPQRARAACVELVKQASTTDSGSLGVRLLADLRIVFGEAADLFDTAPHLFTDTILAALHKMPEAPWSDLKGKPLDSRGLASRLKAYGVGSKKVRIGEATRQGYTAEDLHDPWRRYLPTTDPAGTEHPEHTEPGTSEQRDPVPDRKGVPEQSFQAEHEDPALTSDVPPVPHVPQSANRGSALNGYDSIETVSAAIGVTPLDREIWARVAPGYDQ